MANGGGFGMAIYLCENCDTTTDGAVMEQQVSCTACGPDANLVAIHVDENTLLQLFYTDQDFQPG